MGHFTNNTGGALRYFRNVRLAWPLSIFIVVLRLLPVQFGGVDSGIIEDSAATYDPPDSEVTSSEVDSSEVTSSEVTSSEDTSSEDTSSGCFFPQGAVPTTRDKLLTGVILHDVATTKHKKIHQASRLDTARGAPVAYPLLRTFDDMGGLARRALWPTSSSSCRGCWSTSYGRPRWPVWRGDPTR